MHKDNYDGLGTFVLLFFFAGLVIAFLATRSLWQIDAVKHGAAEYNQTTGKWQWKTNVVTVERK